MHTISPDKYAEFAEACKLEKGMRTGQMFCDVMQLHRSPGMADIADALYELDGQAAMAYIKANFTVE